MQERNRRWPGGPGYLAAVLQPAGHVGSRREGLEMEKQFPVAPGERDEMRPSDETMRCEYEEICRSHLAITDFRGKLLGLLPLAAGTGIVLLLRRSTGTQSSALLAAIGLFGAVVTVGLF